VDIPAQLRSFWQDFAAARATNPTPRFLEAFYFDDNEPSANELAALVLAGRKRATAALLWSHEKENKPIPREGDLSIVTNFAGSPVCVIETKNVEVVPFEEVSEEFAATEGEGDGSLRYWRAAHDAYFGRECQRIGRTPHARMPVVCERFEVVFSGGARGDT
jgi:uncharacterized protein YhfF